MFTKLFVSISIFLFARKLFYYGKICEIISRFLKHYKWNIFFFLTSTYRGIEIRVGEEVSTNKMVD